MKYIPITILLAVIISTSVFMNKARADVYVDIGMAYIDTVDITTSGRVNLFGYEVEAEYTTRLEVEDWVPMLRVGFIHNGWAIEYDVIGAPSQFIPRINLFYRAQWD